MKISTLIAISFLLICSNIKVFSQCSPCTTCNTSTTTGCTTSITANSSAAINAATGTKTCITAGTYTGAVTMNGGTVVVGTGVTFNPTSVSISSGTLEIQGGATSTMPGILGNGNPGFFTLNNCGTVHFTGAITNNGGRMILNNNGIFTSSSTILYNGSVNGSIICNSDSLTCTGLTLNGASGVGLKNNGYLLITGNMVQNGAGGTVDLCCGSKIAITGNWTSNGPETTTGLCPCGIGSYGQIFISNTSVCNGCTVNGCADICDTSGPAVTHCPHIDTNTGTLDTSITSCGAKCSVVVVNPVVIANGGAVCVGSCFNLSATASGGTPPYIYSWSPNIGTGAGPFSVCPGNTTVYTVTVTDAASATATDTAQITVMALPLVDINPPFTNICTGSGTSLTASGALTYTWSPATGLSSTNIANPIANPTSTTIYTITGTGANGCTATATTKVTVNPLPVVSINPPAPAVCFGSSVALSASGGATYSWSPSTGLNSPDSNYTTASPATTTTYTLMATDTNGCTGVTTVQVMVNPLPVAGISPSAPTVCGGVSVALSASGGVSYSWSPSAGLSNPNSANPLANPTTTTTYSLTATDINGCTGVATVKVTVNPTPVASISHSATASCDSNTIYIGYGPQSITFTANTATVLAKYQWYLNGSAIAGDTTNSITVSSGGDYNVIVTDTSGCFSDSTNNAIVVKFVDIRCGHNMDKVLICHVPDCRYPNENTLCIAPPAIAAHLRNHPCDCLGNCPNPRMANTIATEDEAEFSAYPNPFTNETMIEFTVPEAGYVKLELHDMKGALIATPFDAVADGDNLYQIKVDGTKLPQGVYIGSLTTSEGVKHIKLIVTK